MKKVSYKDWKGNNRFYLHGKLMTGSGTDNLLLFIAYTGFFIGLILYHFTLSRYLISTNHLWLSRFGYVLILTNVLMMLMTTFTEPGVVQRGDLNPPDSEANLNHTDEETGFNNKSNFSSIETVESPSETMNDKNLPRDRDMQISLYNERYCTTCRIMRQSKSSHCSSCNNCVKGFDHHCFFLGNCIGIRNHKYFFFFVASGTFMAIYMLVLIFAVLYDVLTTHPDIKYNIFQFTRYIFTMIFCMILSRSLARFRIKGGRRVYYRLGLEACVALCFSFHLHAVSAEEKLDFYQDLGIYFTGLALTLCVGVWLGFYCRSNLRNIFNGITFKERAVIEREVTDQFLLKKFYDLTWSQKLNNLAAFVMRKQIESEVE